MFLPDKHAVKNNPFRGSLVCLKVGLVGLFGSVQVGHG